MERELAMRKIHRFVCNAGGHAQTSALKNLYNDNLWMKSAVGNLGAFCAEGPLAYTPKGAGEPAQLRVKHDTQDTQQPAEDHKPQERNDDDAPAFGPERNQSTLLQDYVGANRYEI